MPVILAGRRDSYVAAVCGPQVSGVMTKIFKTVSGDKQGQIADLGSITVGDTFIADHLVPSMCMSQSKLVVA